MKIKAGVGYYETEYYPIGGSFHRTGSEGLEIEKVTRTLPDYFHGVNTEGLAKNGKMVAFDIRLTE